jgi:hypothetical protein
MRLVAQNCSNCGSVIPAGATFCPQCGQRVREGFIEREPVRGAQAFLSVDSENRPVDPARITNEDAKRIAKAHSDQLGHNTMVGCGVVLVLIVIYLIIRMLFFPA